MSNFLDLEQRDDNKVPESLKEAVSRVPFSSPLTRLDSTISDGIAVQHGFTSRENQGTARSAGGRRQARGMRAEETRQLSIRMPVSLYNDFLSYADANKLSYNEAIRRLLDKA